MQVVTKPEIDIYHSCIQAFASVTPLSKDIEKMSPSYHMIL